MGWNNGLERKRFEARQKKQAEEYRKLGMTEEQIRAMYEFDLEQLKSDRRYNMHTQELTSSEFDDFEEDDDDDSKSALLKKYTAQMTSKLEAMTGDDAKWWLDKVEDERVVHEYRKLCEKDKAILKMTFVEGMSQKEIADKLHCSQPSISQKLVTIYKKLKK